MRTTLTFNATAAALLAAALGATGAQAAETGAGAPPLLLAQSAAASGKPAGHILMTTSNLRAERADGSVRALARRSAVYEGDTLVTGEGGITQVRMADGALLSLRRRTEFHIEEFRYDDKDEGSERGFFALLRGGFRTLTGLIGRNNERNYRVATPVATIGIRGTHFGLRLCIEGDCAAEGVQEDGLYGGVVNGGITASNDAGPARFDNDEYFHVASLDARARSLLAPPGVVFGSDLPLPSPSEPDGTQAQLGLRSLHPESDSLNALLPVDSLERAVRTGIEFAASVDLDDLLRAAPTLDLPDDFVGTVPPDATLPPDGSAAHVSFLQSDALTDFGAAYGVQASGVTPDNLDTTSFIVLGSQDSVGNLVVATQNVDSALCSPCTTFAPSPGARLVTAAVDGNANLGANWGRWSGAWAGAGQDAPRTALPAGDLHFIFSDKLTPENAYSQLTGTFTYNYSGEGTAPTNHAGVEGTLTSASVGVDFGRQSVIGYDLLLTVSGDTVSAGISSGTAVAFSDAANGGILLQGTCTGTGGCGDTTVAGRASTSFVGAVNQGRPEALISSYAVGGTSSDQINPQPIGYSGTFVANP